RVQAGVVEKRAQPGAQGLQHFHDVRLVQIVGKQIHGNRWIVDALLQQVKNHLPGMKAKPLVLRLKWGSVKVQGLRSLRTKVLVPKFLRISLRGQITAGKAKLKVAFLWDQAQA